MSYYSNSHARKPLHDGKLNIGRDPNVSGEGSNAQSSYQPPQQARILSVVATDNPLLWDDDAFVQAAEALLLKRKMSGLSRTKFIYSKMDPAERAQFAAAYSRRYQRMPMFPAADETVLQRWMRTIEEDFGDALLQEVPNRDPTSSTTTTPLLNRSMTNHEVTPHAQYVRSHVTSRDPELQNAMHNQQYQQFQQSHRVVNPNDAQPLVHSSHQELVVPPSNYRLEKNVSATNPLISSHRKQSEENTFYSPQGKDGSDAITRNPAQTMPAYTPTSILKKSRLTRNPVAQIMEVLPPVPVEPTPKTSSLMNVSSLSSLTPKINSVLKLQSTTRQSLMQEIENVNHLVTTLRKDGTNKDNRSTLAHYSEHLRSLKEQLHRLTINDDIVDRNKALEIDRVLPMTRVMTTGSIAEIDEIVGPATVTTIKARSSDRWTNKDTDRRSRGPSRFGGSKTTATTTPTATATAISKTSHLGFSGERIESNITKQDEGPIAVITSVEFESPVNDKRTYDASIPRIVSFERSRLGASEEKRDDADDCDVDNTSNSIIERDNALSKPASLDLDMVNTREVTSTPHQSSDLQQMDAHMNNDQTLFHGSYPLAGKYQSNEAFSTKHDRDGPALHTWKAGLFGCLTHGIAHPIVFHSFICPQIGLTQILHRLQLDSHDELPIAASPSSSSLQSPPHSRLRIKTVLFLTCAFLLLDLLLVCTMIGSPILAAKLFAGILCLFFNIPALLWFHQWSIRTRKQVKAEYNIRMEEDEDDDNNANCCDTDAMISLFCLPCSIGQMMQQTANYDLYRALWWSETGLPHSSPAHHHPFPSKTSASLATAAATP